MDADVSLLQFASCGVPPMRYIIVDHSDARDLSNLVEELLNRGWKLHGGLVVSGEGNTRRFAQALTNEQDSEDESSSAKT